MNIKKITIIFIIFLLLLQPIGFADDILTYSELDNFIEVSNNSKASIIEPITNSKHIIAIDRKTKTILYEKNSNTETPMASTTKIMTCLIALENCNLKDTIEFSKEAATVRGSCLEVTTGTKMSMEDALYGLMMRSRK